jgi:thiamine pyrophosphokinase
MPQPPLVEPAQRYDGGRNDDRGTVIVVAAGANSLPTDLTDAYVIAADSGADAATHLNLLLSEVVGDLDSIRPETLSQLETAGVNIERHSPEKDQTDLELALAAAHRRDPKRIIVLATTEGRLDHLYAILLAITAAARKDVIVDADLGTAQAHTIVDRRTLHGTPGQLISLYAIGEDATGITTTGLRYPLTNATLSGASPLGTSNEFTDHQAEITVAQGRLLAVRPLT